MAELGWIAGVTLKPCYFGSNNNLAGKKMRTFAIGRVLSVAAAGEPQAFTVR